jgi:PA14 domain/Chitobiase/beta-hexosaminidase C-terminal domain
MVPCGSLLICALACIASSTSAAVNVLTFHNDNARTGQNTNETILTPAVVNSANFGKIFSHDVDGLVYAQPLVMTGVSIPGKGTHNVVYVATEHDSVYAFDADDDTGVNAAPLWQVTFINPSAGVTTVGVGDVYCGELFPEIGISSTPVIDAASGTIFVEVKTKEIAGGVTVFRQRLHALDMATGAEKFGGPVLIQASVPGTGEGNDHAGHVPFDPLMELNRTALLLARGVVYIAYASQCDNGPWHGWLLGYDANTLALSNVFNTTANGRAGGIWMGGGGPAEDSAGNIYVETGNGTFDPSAGVYAFGDSFLKLSTTGGLALADYFTPFDQANLNNRDLDVGSGAPVVLPDEAGDGSGNQHLLVGGSKAGKIYLLNRDDLGQYNSGNDNAIVQSIPNAVTSFDTPAYFNHHIYYIGAGEVLKSYTITNGRIDTNNYTFSANDFGFPGATPSVSANGTNNGIVWALDPAAAAPGGPAVLHAYDAGDVTSELYNSSMADSGTRDNPGGAVKFTVPTVANGKVYVGAAKRVSVFGVGNFLGAPVISPAGGVFNNSLQVTLSEPTSGASVFYTLDNSTPTTNSIPYTGPFTITHSTGVRVRAFKPNSVPSSVTVATFLSSASIGTGSGLNGAYYSGQVHSFTNPATLMRTDPTINFDWTIDPLDPSIDPNNFTVMWSGMLQPQFSETYTFYTTVEQAARLWVDGQLLVDDWVNEWDPTEFSGSIALQAGRLYPVTMEFYQDGASPAAYLAWSSASTAKQIIPQSQLYPRAPAIVSVISAPAGGAKLQVNGLPGKDYILQASADLKNWTGLQTNLAPPNPDLTVPTNLTFFVDLKATNFPARFYRVLQGL